MATKEGNQIKGKIKKKMSRHSIGGMNHLEQESNRQRTMEHTGGLLHPAVDGQSLGEK